MEKTTIKRIVGLLLLIVVLHFIFSNFDVLNHLVGFAVEVQENPQIQNLEMTKQTIVEPLKIRENSFKEDFNRFLFLMNISNIDDVEGNVTVTLICNRSNFFKVQKTASIMPGEDYMFNFSTLQYSCKSPKYTYQAQDVRRVIER